MTAKRYSLGKIGCYRTKLIVDNETKHEMGNSVVVKRLNTLHEECLQYLNIIGDIRVYAKENDIENILKIINKLEMELIENV